MLDKKIVAKKLKELMRLVENFINDKIKSKEFEKKYISLSTYIIDNKLEYSEKILGILGTLNIDVSHFEANEILRKGLLKEDEYKIPYYTEAQLRNKAKGALKKLKKLVKNDSSINLNQSRMYKTQKKKK